jgi:hypothetical protein
MTLRIRSAVAGRSTTKATAWNAGMALGYQLATRTCVRTATKPPASVKASARQANVRPALMAVVCQLATLTASV